MRRHDDRMMRAIREADPAASPQVTDWVETGEAALIAERVRAEGDRDVQVRQPMPRRPGRRLVILIALLVIAASAVAASVALRSSGPSRPAPIVCYSALGPDGTSIYAPAGPGVGPVEACRRIWSEAFRVQPPAQLIVCVEPYGGFVVYPLPRDMSGSDACDTMGDALYSPDDVGE